MCAFNGTTGWWDLYSMLYPANTYLLFLSTNNLRSFFPTKIHLKLPTQLPSILLPTLSSYFPVSNWNANTPSGQRTCRALVGLIPEFDVHFLNPLVCAGMARSVHILWNSWCYVSQRISISTDLESGRVIGRPEATWMMCGKVHEEEIVSYLFLHRRYLLVFKGRQSVVLKAYRGRILYRRSTESAAYADERKGWILWSAGVFLLLWKWCRSCLCILHFYVSTCQVLVYNFLSFSFTISFEALGDALILKWCLESAYLLRKIKGERNQVMGKQGASSINEAPWQWGPVCTISKEHKRVFQYGWGRKDLIFPMKKGETEAYWYTFVFLPSDFINYFSWKST